MYISQKQFLSICKRYDDVLTIIQKLAFERTGHYKEVIVLVLSENLSSKCIIKLRQSMQREQERLAIQQSQPGTLVNHINGTIRKIFIIFIF